ncbi:MAG: hypothetical protein HQL78_02690 [Magnetococcales bacterium]|nr:hypothetical protein [Magnetococcales bacterium]
MMFPINKQRPPEMSKAWKITWLDAADDIPESMWDMCFPPPLEGRWWYKALELSGLDDQFQFQYGVVSHADRAVAIAPVFIMDVPITILAPPWLCSVIHALKGIAPSLQFHRTVFVGSPCSDEGHVGILPGVDRMAVFITIQEALPERVARFKATWLSWKDFPPPGHFRLARIAAQVWLVSSGLFSGNAVRPAGTRQNGLSGVFEGKPATQP